LTKRICLVTGGTSGVGKAAALGLAETGAAVVITGRNRERGKAVIDKCLQINPAGIFQFIEADMSTRQGIRTVADEYTSRFDSLNVLLNCMGILSLKRETTADGIEKTFFIDYLSHFMITALLVDLLKQGQPSRIITISGGPGMLEKTRINTGDLQFANGYNGFKAAVQAAMCRAIFSFELAEKPKGTGVTAHTFHPGLVKTRLSRKLPIVLRAIVAVAAPFMRERCPTAVFAATSPSLEETTGQFLDDSKIIPFNPKYYKKEDVDLLWAESERLCGVQLR
jgi:NAD(P)-dependent dehydrogenase (short-subunit alcohol dehydrogenase family)